MVDRNNLAESSSIGVTAVILSVASIISLYKIYSLFKSRLYFEAQKYLICIFLMPILIGWAGWIELLEEKKTPTLGFTQNLFKSACLASFMLYVERILGWEQDNGQNVYSEEIKFRSLVTGKAPRCLCRCIKFKPIETTEDAKKYMNIVRFYVLQLCVILVFLGIIGLIIILTTDKFKFGEQSLDSIWFYFNMIQAISSVFALLILLNFGMYVNALPDMGSLQILHKFAIIKLGLLFTEFQPIIISGIARTGAIVDDSDYSNDEITLYTSNLLLCSEMIIMSFLIILIFPDSDYLKTPDVRKIIEHNEDSYLKL
ncbi:hypothetical protein SteCoe_38878 [Stentor coeruleus]|uniref:Uncharacterized protein n=1 Tax=Stentor coeruleus TaxID=5963 RepID=A0A1R2AKY9_9CILI|nr:hypothetical protein SteCoe_38878 [Stentor coeruleus]